jgi:hypothetical protein
MKPKGKAGPSPAQRVPAPPGATPVDEGGAATAPPLAAKQVEPGCEDAEALEYTRSQLTQRWLAGVEKGQEMANADGAKEWDKFRLDFVLCIEDAVERELRRMLEQAEIEYFAGPQFWQEIAESKDANKKKRVAVAKLAGVISERVLEIKRKMAMTWQDREEAMYARMEANAINGTLFWGDDDWFDCFRLSVEIGQLLGRLEAVIPRPSMALKLYEALEKWRRDAKYTKPNLKFDVQTIMEYGDDELKRLSAHRLETLLTDFRKTPYARRGRPSKTPGDRMRERGPFGRVEIFYDARRGAELNIRPKSRKRMARPVR